jgi:hypothetical protein
VINLISLLNPGNMEEAYLDNESIPQLIYSLVYISFIENFLITKFNLSYWEVPLRYWVVD